MKVRVTLSPYSKIEDPGLQWKFNMGFHTVHVVQIMGYHTFCYFYIVLPFLSILFYHRGLKVTLTFIKMNFRENFAPLNPM